MSVKHNVVIHTDAATASFGIKLSASLDKSELEELRGQFSDHFDSYDFGNANLSRYAARRSSKVTVSKRGITLTVQYKSIPQSSTEETNRSTFKSDVQTDVDGLVPVLETMIAQYVD